ncbi:MAG: hypothetical protein IJ855_00330 [Bacteroidales bacterium]|nr:hypothetical protein [Bacteroidales bacterium]
MYSLTKQQKQTQEGKRIGMVLTIAFHVVLLFVLGITGFRLVYPPPAEKGILLEIPLEEEPRKAVPKKSPEPRAPEADPTKEVNIVQKAKAPLQSEKSDAGKPATAQGKGDVEIPEPKREIDRRALFPSADNKKDTGKPQTAEEASPELKAGHSKGNTENGKLNGKPSVRLEGRSTLGSLPLPAYTVNESGTVVVQIVVNEKGIVTNAIPGQKGTTTNNPTLWAEARKAALKARFSPSDAPTQVGYITYVFILK